MSVLASHTISPGALATLAQLRDRRGRTRSELAEIAEIARSTVGLRVSELLEHGLVTETDDVLPTGGRPSTLVRLEPTAACVLAVDSGVRHLRIGLFDLGRELVGEAQLAPPDPDDPIGTLERIARETRSLLDRTGWAESRLRAVGFGITSPIDRTTRRPLLPARMPGWDGFDVSAWFQNEFHVPAVLEKDVNMMAIGDHAARLDGPDDLVYLKVASGVGAGIFIDGRLYRGADGTAGDIGHVPVTGSTVVCTCGNVGCLEATASAAAIVNRLNEEGYTVEDPEGVRSLVRAEDARAVAIIRQAGRSLGEVLAAYVSILNPGLIVIGGVPHEVAELLVAGVRESIYRTSRSITNRRLAVVAATRANDDALRGAAVAALDVVLGVDRLP